MEPEVIEVSGGNFIKLRPKEAPGTLGISRKHFNDEANAHSWQKESLGSAVYYFVPVEYYEMRQQLLKLREVTSPEAQTSNGGRELGEVLPPVHEQDSPTAKDSGEVIKRFETRLAQLEDQVRGYNTEIEARNTALVKYKDQERIITEQQQQIDDLQRKMLLLEQELTLRKAWWKFWK